ncbi:hypothetical protein IW140_000275 [Coemansia sp. RSA 1813]|nr:hypothetical protein EV178_000476 [Coemansia sp. RSA 1646]KAJ1773755.1 hypothetical protein LPJ74_000298 [Coemansia sp. RSA 1843]KAJ2093715.1 hypothetical protein IW138_000110 [Coemansia sp. RSA 986]KAJ2217929.1 hypothetical protein EV179_000073 [Coemansia sp. RSA 487]KAJ2573231.1 hypothetical protein IW140_000275 [Coemansia sp. RSA 1813]
MLYRSSQQRPQTRAPFRVYADAQPLTSTVASVPKPRYARLRASQSDTAGCAVLRELSANNDFKLSPNSQIRAEKENFDPARKQFVRNKYINTNSTCTVTATPLKEKKHQISRQVPDFRMPSHVPSHGNRNRNQVDNERQAPIVDRRSDELATPKSVRMVSPKCPALVHNNGRSGSNPNVVFPRSSDVKRISLLLDDMTLSTRQQSANPTVMEHSQNRSYQTALMRLSLPPPAFVPSGRNTRNSGKLPSYTTRNASKDHIVHAKKSQVLWSNSNKNDSNSRAKKPQLNVNILTPPGLRQSIR